jgi:hypothetical protein
MTNPVPSVRAAIFILATSVSLAVHAASLADLVFANARGTPNLLQALTPDDRQAVASLLPITLGSNGKVIDNTAVCGQEARPELSVVDLRHDGQPAVFAVTGNSCTSGGTGASLYLVAKVAGQWKCYFDVPAIEYRVLRSRVNGWQEIGVLGRYECMGVWQFNGTAYKHSRNVDGRGVVCKP